MRKNLVFQAAVACLMLAIAGAAMAADKTWRVSLAQMPGYAESTEKGVLVDFVKALEKVSGDRIELQVVPFQRSMNDVQERKVDFHMPLIQLPGSGTGTSDFDYSTETIFHVNFVLYSAKGRGVKPENASRFKVETDQAHVAYFDFPIAPSSNLEASLKKVNAGRIDAFIFADMAADPLVAKNGLTDIERQLYKRFSVRVVLPKGEHGGATDQFLSDAIGKLRASGEMERIMGVIDQPYRD